MHFDSSSAIATKYSAGEKMSLKHSFHDHAFILQFERYLHNDNNEN